MKISLETHLLPNEVPMKFWNSSASAKLPCHHGLQQFGVT